MNRVLHVTYEMRCEVVMCVYTKHEYEVVLVNRTSFTCYTVHTVQRVPCDLLTGEERALAGEFEAAHLSCTIEMTSTRGGKICESCDCHMVVTWLSYRCHTVVTHQCRMSSCHDTVHWVVTWPSHSPAVAV